MVLRVHWIRLVLIFGRVFYDMSTTKIIQTRNLKGLVSYALGEDLDRGVAISSINCSVLSASEQMLYVIDSYNKRDNVQGLHVIQTFRNDELNPKSEDDIQKANDAGNELARRLYPNRQILVVTQIDGDSGLIHNHICVNQVDLLTGKSLANQQKNHFHVARENDRVLDDMGINNVLADKRAYYREDKSYHEELSREGGYYLGKDDLRDKIQSVLDEDKPKNYDELSMALEFYGVTFSFKERKRGESEIQFEYLDFKRTRRTCMGRRLKDSNGNKFNNERFANEFERNSRNIEQERQAEMVRKQNQLMHYLKSGNSYMVQWVLDKNPEIQDFYDSYIEEMNERIRQRKQQIEADRIAREEMEKQRMSSEAQNERLDVKRVRTDIDKVVSKKSNTEQSVASEGGKISDAELLAKLANIETDSGYSDKQKSDLDFWY